MGANTRGLAGVGTASAAQEIGATLTRLTVMRRANLPRELNGAPKPCSDPRAQHVRSEMQRRDGGSRYWDAIMAAAFCDLADGVSLDAVVGTFLVAIEACHAQAMPRTFARPLGAVQVAEMKAEHALNLVQAQIDREPENPAVLEAGLMACDQYAPVLTALRETVAHQLAVVRTKPRTVYGARRDTGALTLHHG